MTTTKQQTTSLGDTVTTRVLEDGAEDITIEVKTLRPSAPLRLVEDRQDIVEDLKVRDYQEYNRGRVWPSAR